jgi:tetratricopeptide (TPR) repeat protein
MEALERASAGHLQDGIQLFDQLAKQSGKGNEVEWRLARTKYLDVIGDPGAKAAWVAVRDAYPNDLTVQRAALNGRAVHGDWQFMQPVIDNLRAMTGDNGLMWRLAQATMRIESPRGEDDIEKGSVELNGLIESYPQLDQPHVLLARALIHMKRLDGAVEQLTIATRLQPASADISLELANLLETRGQYDAAALELDRITVATTSFTPHQWDQVATLYAKVGKVDHALQLLQKQDAGATTQPSQTEAGSSERDQRDLLIATLERVEHRADEAETIVRRLLARPNLVTVQFAASLFRGDGHLEDAESALRLLDGMKLDPGAKEMTLGAYYYTEAHDAGEALKHFEAAAQQAPANNEAWQQELACELSLGKTGDAMATLNQAIATIPGDAGLKVLKQHSQLLVDATNNVSLQAAALSVVENPLDSDLVLQLIQIVLDGRKANNLEGLAGQLLQFAQSHPDYPQAQLQLVQCYLDEGRVDDALATAQRAMAAFPNNPDPARAAMLVSRSSGRWQDMESAAQSLKARSPDMAEEADTAAADADIHMQAFQAAQNYLEPYLAAAQKDSDHHAAVLATAAVADADAGDVDAASNLLWPHVAQSSMWRQLWIEVALQLPTPEQTMDWLNRLTEVIPQADIHERTALAEAYDRVGRAANNRAWINESSAMFDAILTDPRADATVMLMAASQAERCGRNTDAQANYRRAVAADETLWIAMNNLAMSIVNNGGDLKEADTLAREAIQLQPHNADLYDTLAAVQAKEGDLNSAAATVRVAIDLQPDTLKWQVRLTRYLLDSGQFNEASKALSGIDATFRNLDSQKPDLKQQLADIRRQIHGKGS